MRKLDHLRPEGRGGSALPILAMLLGLPALVAAGIGLADWQPHLQALVECPPTMAQAEGRQP